MVPFGSISFRTGGSLLFSPDLGAWNRGLVEHLKIIEHVDTPRLRQPAPQFPPIRTAPGLHLGYDFFDDITISEEGAHFDQFRWLAAMKCRAKSSSERLGHRLNSSVPKTAKLTATLAAFSGY